MNLRNCFCLLACTLLLNACSSKPDYNSAECEELAVKIGRNEELTQDDYAEMIAQDEAILIYLVEQSQRIAQLPDDQRADAWRELQADPEYLERFGNSFTLGSTLYEADSKGLLDEKNSKAFKALDQYNAKF